jgi:hypothetical protein
MVIVKSFKMEVTVVVCRHHEDKARGKVTESGDALRVAATTKYGNETRATS